MEIYRENAAAPAWASPLAVRARRAPVPATPAKGNDMRRFPLLASRQSSLQWLKEWVLRSAQIDPSHTYSSMKSTAYFSPIPAKWPSFFGAANLKGNFEKWVPELAQM